MERMGEIFLLSELSDIVYPNLSNSDTAGNPEIEFKSKYVRVTGYVTEYDPGRAQCFIVHGNHKLVVDLKLVLPQNMSNDALFQFIGELCLPEQENSSSVLILRARIAKNVDGMDIKLYEELLLARRRFLAVSIHDKLPMARVWMECDFNVICL